MKNTEILLRIDQLIQKGESTLKTVDTNVEWYANRRYSSAFRSASLSLISSLFGKNHSYYTEFEKLDSAHPSNIRSGIGIIESIKDEIENGWLITYKQLVTAEVFSDFLEMAKYLLDEKFKDAAAVMIGSILEEHLRQLCITKSIDVTTIKGSDMVPKKADVLNVDLTKKGVYNGLQQKSVTAWLDLRNKAAHGKYGEYTFEQVGVMYMGVADFVSRIN